MCGYGVFSNFYDLFTRDVDYKGRTDYLYGLFKRFSAPPTLLLDLACGSGSFACEFSKKGIEVIGVDPSEGMLCAAREKAAACGQDVLFLCQSAQELELYGTVDGAVCCLDSINHITDGDVLQKAFCKVSLFLEPEKLFIFDVNTPYKHEKVLGDETFVRETDDVFCVWQNEYDAQTKTTSMYLDFFCENDGRYDRFSEDFCERAYTDGQIKNMLAVAGFEVVALYGDMTVEEPTFDSQRNVYVARKVN